MIGFLLRLKLWFYDNEVFYIHGSDTLPPPLSKAEEAAVLERMKAGVPRAGEPLISPKNSSPRAQALRI